MTNDEIVKALRDLLPPKIDYAELVGAEGFAHGVSYVWDDPEPYIIENAADLIESLQSQLSEKDAEIKRLNDEPPAYKFYYCESENSYLLGRRMDTMYYAHWYDGCGFVWDMSRYLPWGEHVVALRTAWKEHTYPSEPKEIDSSEWFKGFLAQRLSDSQRRADAAVEDARQGSVCRTCHYLNNGCEPLNLDAGCHKWQWRGHQEAGEGDNNGNVC